MKTSPLGSSAVRVACFVALASSPSLSQIRAETAAEHKLTVYRQTYAQLIELGLRPTEAASGPASIKRTEKRHSALVVFGFEIGG